MLPLHLEFQKESFLNFCLNNLMSLIWCQGVKNFVIHRDTVEGKISSTALSNPEDENIFKFKIWKTFYVLKARVVLLF